MNIMHKIKNTCYDVESHTIGFELDNTAVIYQHYDLDYWTDSDFPNTEFKPVLDADHNLLGFIAETVIHVDKVEVGGITLAQK